MGKRFNIMVICLTLLFTPVSSFSFNNEPDGFRGIKWGTHISKIKNMVFGFTWEGKKLYSRQGEKKKIGDADIDGISYEFYNDKLSGLTIAIKGYSDFNKIRATLFHAYGTVKYKNGFSENSGTVVDIYRWAGEKVIIELEYEESIELGTVYYTYLPSLDERKKDLEKSKREIIERSKQGVKDL